MSMIIFFPPLLVVPSLFLSSPSPLPSPFSFSSTFGSSISSIDVGVGFVSSRIGVVTFKLSISWGCDSGVAG